MYNDEPGIESNQCLKSVSFLAATAVISFFKIKYETVFLHSWADNDFPFNCFNFNVAGQRASNAHALYLDKVVMSFQMNSHPAGRAIFARNIRFADFTLRGCLFLRTRSK